MEHVEYGVCPVCGDHVFPITPLLPCGHDEAPVRHPFDAVGEVYAWTRSWVGASEQRIVAMVDFHELGLRVSSPVAADGEIAIGERMQVRPGTATPYELVPVR